MLNDKLNKRFSKNSNLLNVFKEKKLHSILNSLFDDDSNLMYKEISSILNYINFHFNQVLDYIDKNESFFKLKKINRENIYEFQDIILNNPIFYFEILNNKNKKKDLFIATNYLKATYHLESKNILDDILLVKEDEYESEIFELKKEVKIKPVEMITILLETNKKLKEFIINKEEIINYFGNIMKVIKSETSKFNWLDYFNYDINYIPNILVDYYSLKVNPIAENKDFICELIKKTPEFKIKLLNNIYYS